MSSVQAFHHPALIVSVDLAKPLAAVALAAVVATVAVLYAEVMFRITTKWYRQGLIKRYGPLPSDRNVVSNWLNAFGFTVPAMVFALHSTLSWYWAKPNIFQLYIYTAAYMVLHDVIFYALHRTFHASKGLYKLLHEKHHDYSKAMNVFVVGYAEVTENMLQVGIPWLVWTMLAGWASGGSIPLVTIPMSVVLFTTLLGHSGAKMHPYMFIFHPWAAVMLLPIASVVLTPGDHQMHHVYRRCNMGLFFRFFDKLGGTYRRNVIAAHDVNWWVQEVAANPKQEKDKSKVAFDLIEVSFGF